MPQTRPLLTIAIPTYNRAELLSITLEGVAAQIAADPRLRERVELLVVDNASTDATATVVRAVAARHPFVHYRRNEKNFGIDGNIYRCTLFAAGEYVHLLSDDDVVLPGGVRAVVARIEQQPEVGFFYLNLRPFCGDFALSRLGRPVFPAGEDRLFHDPSAFIAYVWVYLTFVSSFVLHRDTWFRSQAHESYLGTDIYLSYALFDHLAQCSAMVFVSEPIIAIRAHYSGNYRMFYAFAFQWRKLLLEHAPALGFERKTMEETFRRSIRADLLPRVINYRVNHGELDAASRALIVENTRDFPSAWLLLYPFVFIPRRLLRALHALGKPLQTLLRRA